MEAQTTLVWPKGRCSSGRAIRGSRGLVLCRQSKERGTESSVQAQRCAQGFCRPDISCAAERLVQWTRALP